MFCYSEDRGAEAPVLPASKSVRFIPDIAIKNPRNFGDIFPAISGIFSPRFRGFVSRDYGNFPPAILGVEMPKCADSLGAPDAMMMVRTATPVLDDAWTRCLTPCHALKPAESGVHFGRAWHEPMARTCELVWLEARVARAD